MTVAAKRFANPLPTTVRARPLRLLFLAVIASALPFGAFGGAVPHATPEDVGLSSERLERVTEVVRRHIEAGDVSGAVTLVARRGHIAHYEAQGFLDIESQTPMPTDAIFRLASMSKPITAVAIMMLVEQGEIRLDDPVSRFIPEFADSNKVAVPRPGGEEGQYDLVTATRPITIRDLLTHGSGLVSGGLGARAASELAPRTPRDTLATYIPKLAAVPLDFQPGSLWRYSGQAGFDTMSRIVEVVSGHDYDDYLDEHLLGPLAMPDTGFYFDGEQAGRVPTYYARTAEGSRPTPRELNRVYFSGAGGMASAAEDYLQFAQMLLNGGQLNGRRFLGARTVELMTANHTGDMVNGQFGRPARGIGFGLSVQVVEDSVAARLAISKGAYGWAGGTGVSFWIEPEEELVSIYMVQGGSGGNLRRAFENAVRQAIID
ncbi:serine hydrolase domain-containing protein [Candidatus Rariloculus sp.]|uniref:serine hydrolase domain-containing protein n=1 Tax=Candidatus Rariloculus sp. TaxID=3101265 RepID=UPI003D0C58C3